MSLTELLLVLAFALVFFLGVPLYLHVRYGRPAGVPFSVTLGYWLYAGRSYKRDEAPAGNVRIVMDQHGRGDVFIDGQKLNRCRSFSLSAEVGELNLLQLVLVPEKIEVEGVFDVSVLNHNGSRVYEKFEAAPGHAGGGIGGPQPERFRGEPEARIPFKSAFQIRPIEGAR